MADSRGLDAVSAAGHTAEPATPDHEPRPDFPVPGAPPPESPPAPVKRAAQIRAQLSSYRQRTILFLRWLLRPFYRIPLDDLKEATRDQDIRFLYANQKQLLAALNHLIETNNDLQSRLVHYEHNIPRMRELKRELKGFKPKSNGNLVQLVKP